MSLRIGINGFGRIGRLVARAVYETGLSDQITLAAFNDTSTNTLLLLKYDSVHGPAPFTVERESDDMKIFAGHKVRRFQSREPENIDWGSENVDIVLECTGQFTDREGASQHLARGAKKVLISAPAKGDDLTVVYGVNDDKIKADHTIISNASCTTNCLAPIAFMLHKEIGIEHGFMTTIHSYTGDQRTVDSSHRDPYRGRAAALNLIPTTTGAAKSVGRVLPELDGRLDGVSIRVPTPNVSLVDFKFTAARDTSVDEINEIATRYAAGRLKKILGVYDEPLVSTDFNHNPHSAMFSVEGTHVIGKRFVRVMAWYDNEWAFSLRMLETALKMHQAGYK